MAASSSTSVAVFDPGLGRRAGFPSPNLGDVIIQQAVRREIAAIWPTVQRNDLPVHRLPANSDIEQARRARWLLVGGSNIVGSYGYRLKGWHITLKQAYRLRERAVLFGCGWGWYQQKPLFPARVLLRLLLSRTAVHSVRDEYTANHLRTLGYANVLNTACPTMWPIGHGIASQGARTNAVITTLTDYRADPAADIAALSLLVKRYSRVVMWLQGEGDSSYLASLSHEIVNKLEIVEHDYAAYESLLTDGNRYDYVGTRLHGGIRALVAGHRALIIAVDNRSIEIARDTGLPIANRGDLQAIRSWIENSADVSIHLPTCNIADWRAQFHQTQ
jgi:polysaccharide pyruvyl transferase WcaK-like protein